MLNSSMNFINKQFGLNIQVPTRTLKQFQKTAEKAVGSIVAPTYDYFESANKVFSGDVAQEIQKINQRTYALGVTMRQGKPRPTINFKA